MFILIMVVIVKVLITGAESGIGFLTGITLSDRGHIVYMTTHTEKEKEKGKYRERIKLISVDDGKDADEN